MTLRVEINVDIVCCCLHPLTLSLFFLFSGGDATEVRLQPAELLDDPVPEAAEHQTTESAYAGAEGVMEGSD